MRNGPFEWSSQKEGGVKLCQEWRTIILAGIFRQIIRNQLIHNCSVINIIIDYLIPMRIEVSKKLPPIKELAEILKHEFSHLYTYKVLGLGKKSILVGKSTLIGAQISVLENEVSIASSPPSVFAGILQAVGLTEFAIFLLPIFFHEGLPLPSKYSELEKEIGSFLQYKYS